MSLNNKFPVRKQLRLKGYDYSNPGFYFVTIDCKYMECRFGQIQKGQMVLNEFGEIAFNEWTNIPSRFINVQLYDFQIMPNHMHGIVEIVNANNTRLENNNDRKNRLYFTRAGVSSIVDSNQDVESSVKYTRAGASPAPTEMSLDGNEESQRKIFENLCHKSLSDIIGAYKSIVANTCLELHKEKYKELSHIPLLGKIWHRSFYDHIIPDGPSFKSVSRYIRNNPKKWNHL